MASSSAPSPTPVRQNMFAECYVADHFGPVIDTTDPHTLSRLCEFIEQEGQKVYKGGNKIQYFLAHEDGDTLCTEGSVTFKAGDVLIIDLNGKPYVCNRFSELYEYSEKELVQTDQLCWGTATAKVSNRWAIKIKAHKVKEMKFSWGTAVLESSTEDADYYLTVLTNTDGTKSVTPIDTTNFLKTFYIGHSV